MFAVTALVAGDDNDPPRGLPAGLITPPPAAAAVPAFSTAAAASNPPPPAEEEAEALGPSRRLLVLLLLSLLSVQSPLTRRVPLLALLVERRPRRACSKGLPVSVVSALGDAEPGEPDEIRGGGGEGGGLVRAENAGDLTSDPRVLPTPKKSPVTAGASDVAVEPRTAMALAKGFDGDDGVDDSDRSSRWEGIVGSSSSSSIKTYLRATRIYAVCICMYP